MLLCVSVVFFKNDGPYTHLTASSLLQKLKASGFTTFEECDRQMAHLRMMSQAGLMQPQSYPKPILYHPAELEAPTTAFCSLHGKQRLTTCLFEVSPGRFQCDPNFACKGAIRTESFEEPLLPPQSYPQPIWRTPAPLESEMAYAHCALHGKRRMVTCLAETAPGVFECRPEFQCKGAPLLSEAQRERFIRHAPNTGKAPMESSGIDSVAVQPGILGQGPQDMGPLATEESSGIDSVAVQPGILGQGPQDMGPLATEESSGIDSVAVQPGILGQGPQDMGPLATKESSGIDSVAVQPGILGQGPQDMGPLATEESSGIDSVALQPGILGPWPQAMGTLATATTSLPAHLGSTACAVHGKPRTLPHLVEVAPGVFHCAPGFECKVATQWGECQTHGKRRPVRFLTVVMETADGNVYECAEGFECQDHPPGGAGTSTGTKRPCGSTGGPSLEASHPKRHKSGDVPPALERGVCAVHGKQRALSFMQKNDADEWVCTPEWECKTASAPVMLDPSIVAASCSQELPTNVQCALHGRSRSILYMQLVGDGHYVCKPEAQCK